jgi:hypothetical protein
LFQGKGNSSGINNFHLQNQQGKKMKAVVIGESSGASMEAIMKVYPRHKAIVDKYIAKGGVIGSGPFYPCFVIRDYFTLLEWYCKLESDRN